MKEVGKALATAVIWAGIAGLSYLFHSFGVLDSGGAIGLVAVAVFLTMMLWFGV